MKDKKHTSGKGFVLALYDPEASVWNEDATQPMGAWNIAVDSKGLPAFSSFTAPRHIFHKKDTGEWIELSVCTWQVAFG
jgi:hypothetical protein